MSDYPTPSNPTCRNCGKGRHEHRLTQKPPVTVLLCPDSNHPFDPGCQHTADPAYNGRWCGVCNPEWGGDAGGIDPPEGEPQASPPPWVVTVPDERKTD